MSEEQLNAFLEAVKVDAGLQEQLKAAADPDAVVGIAKTAGFVISVDELQNPRTEISDEEMESVTGGTGRAEAIGNLGQATIEMLNGAFGWNIPNKYHK